MIIRLIGPSFFLNFGLGWFGFVDQSCLRLFLSLQRLFPRHHLLHPFDVLERHFFDHSELGLGIFGERVAVCFDPKSDGVAAFGVGEDVLVAALAVGSFDGVVVF